MGLTRRQFFKVATTAAGAVAFTGCYPVPETQFKITSPVRIPEDTLDGVDSWFATICQMCPGHEGVLVRLINGRAKKIEGNPDYPVNVGKTAARCQAAVQELYHPDRIPGPRRRTGDRGSGQYQPISWDDALGELRDQLGGLLSRNQGNSLLFITEPLRAHQAVVVDRFTRALGGQHLAYEPFGRVVERAAIQRVFGQDRLPDFDIAQARYLISFGADFLGTWLSPVQYGRAYGAFRQGRPGRRGHFVHVEPRLSHTAASADQWVPVRPGSEGLLALSIAQQLIAQNLADPGAIAGRPAGALDAFLPQRVADRVGVPADRIVALARGFGSEKPSLAIAGDAAAAQTNGLFNLIAIYTLNVLVGNVGQAGGVRFNPPPPGQELGLALNAAPFRTWQQTAERLRSGQPPVNAVLVHRANPVYGLPAQIGFAQGLARVPFIASFSSFLDETTAMADLILPDHHFLEAWGDDVPDPGPGFPTVGLQQPVVSPFYDTRSFYDALLRVGRQIGGAFQPALPWPNFREALREGIRQLQGQGGSFQSQDLETFWEGLLQRGGWWNPTPAAPAAPAQRPAPTVPTQAPDPTFAGDSPTYPFHLIVYPHNTLFDGDGAHLPWLQATPDPMTTAVWQSWVELNPHRAEELGLHTGDVVAVESPAGRVEAPVYVYPGIGPDVVAMPAGQGHRSYGRYAEKRGVNPFEILAPLAETETGGLAWAATRVRLSKTGRKVRLPVFEGTVPPIQMEGHPLVRVIKES